MFSTVKVTSVLQPEHPTLSRYKCRCDVVCSVLRNESAEKYYGTNHNKRDSVDTERCVFYCESNIQSRVLKLLALHCFKEFLPARVITSLPVESRSHRRGDGLGGSEAARAGRGGAGLLGLPLDALLARHQLRRRRQPSC